MKYAHSMAALVAATIMATPALAQSAPEPTQSSQATAKTFTETDISKFAKAAVEVNQIEKNAAVSEAEKTAQKKAAIQKQGLDTETYNALAQATQPEPKMRNRKNDLKGKRGT